MFERLTERFETAFRNFTGRGRLTETNVSDALREIRRALLDADVNYAVTKEFVADVRRECLGEKVMKSVTPAQQAVKVVSDHLTALLGESNAPLELKGDPAVLMLVGLHGSGKTTTCAKLARHLRDRDSRNVLLAAADLYRPAAVDQLESLGRSLQFDVFSDRGAESVPELGVECVRHAGENGFDTVIIDTAGRHQVDTDLVEELVELKRRTQACEILLVADAALGQAAVSVAEHFDEALGITGIVLTKLDGDARGGAALAMRQVTGKPIKFVGVGERPVDLEPFFPDRMSSRILGMGDVVSLVEKATEQYEEEEARRLEEKMRKRDFDFEDFLSQVNKIRKMGGVASLLKMLPGMGKLPDGFSMEDDAFGRVEGIIRSMTPGERQNPSIISISRRRRIARGSGVKLTEVNQLMKQFDMMRNMMAKVSKMGGAEIEDLMGDGGSGGAFPGLGAGGAGLPSGGMFGGGGPGLSKPMGGSGKKRMKSVRRKKWKKRRKRRKRKRR